MFRQVFAVLAGFVLAASPARAFDVEVVTGAKPLSAFRAVYIAPVALALADDRRARPVDERDALDIAADFAERLEAAFDDDFEIAPAPGPGVLSIEATLTTLAASRPTPADLRAEPSLSSDSVYAGGAAFRAVLSEDGAILAEVADAVVGDLGDGFPRVGVWQEADRAVARWSRALVRFVEEN